MRVRRLRSELNRNSARSLHDELVAPEQCTHSTPSVMVKNGVIFKSVVSKSHICKWPARNLYPTVWAGVCDKNLDHCYLQVAGRHDSRGRDRNHSKRRPSRGRPSTASG